MGRCCAATYHREPPPPPTPPPPQYPPRPPAKQNKLKQRNNKHNHQRQQAAVSGSEPSDAIRAVNALLTQLDALRRRPNAVVLTTSNITEAIDAAFVDRADIKVCMLIDWG